MRKLLFLILFSLNFCFGQQNKSIERYIEKYERLIDNNPDSAFYYINKAKSLSINSKNVFLLSKCFSRLGLYYDSKKDFKTSKNYVLKSLVLCKKCKNYKTLSFCYNYLGLLETGNCNYNLSLKYLLSSLEIASKNNFIENKCNALNNLGNLYIIQKDTIKALEYYKLNEKISLENNLEENLMYIYASIADLKRESNKNQTINYYDKSLIIAKKIKNEYQQFTILINLSDFYLKENKTQSNQKALNCLTQAKTLALKMKSPINLFYVYFNIGGYYFKIEKFDLALENYNKALDLAPQIGDKEQTLNIYKALSDTYKIDKQFEKAIRFQEKYHGLKDSIFNIDKNKAFNEIQTKYEVEKKNLKINLLSREKLLESNKKRFAIYIAVAILLPVLFLMFFYRNSVKLQKIINVKENQLFAQEKTQLKQEQELKRILGVVEGQDEERNRLAKEIHDGVGGTLAGVKLNLSQINSNIKNQNIDKVIFQLNDLFQELRAISHNLSSNFIIDKNFSSLLLDLKNEYESRKAFCVELTIYPENGLETLSNNIKHQIYRIIQELLTNISKHAQAKNIAIGLTNHINSLNLMVEDDGIGFDVSNNIGIGLKNIQERLKTINGKIIIETSPGKGSCFIIDIEN